MKERQAKLSIYIIIAIAVLGMGIPTIRMCIRTMDFYALQPYQVVDAHLDATLYEFVDRKPLPLVGEWNVYEGIYLEDGNTEVLQEYQCEPIYLPTMNLIQTKNAQTYQMFLALDVKETERNQLYLSIPLANPSAKVYMNGNLVYNSSHDDSWLHLKSENGLYYLGAYYQRSFEYQEILITVPQEKELTNLYNREISISTYNNYVADEKVSQSVQLLLIGMMIMIILVGFSYMVLVPSYTMLTLMNLFDAAMMIHLLFNMSTIPNIALATMQGGNWGCYLFRQLDLGFLMFAGMLAPLLGKALFDPENKSNKVFTVPVIGIYALIGIALAIKPELLNSHFVIAIFAVTFLALLCVMAQILVAIKDGRMTGYLWFHVVKTIYIGGVILLDIATLSSGSRNDVFMLLLYGIFFLIHLFVKAYEYKLLFANIELMNVHLEHTVRERTKELQLANDELRDISTRDVLTRSHNRLYFEEEFNRNMERLEHGRIQQFHLCMFDLDGFKSINDQYGHAEGDEQLIETAQIATEYTSDTVDFARIGGEEFAILFVDKEDAEVIRVAEAIRSDLQELASERPDRTTGSFGIYKAHPMDENKMVYSRADQCLYYSKEHGKNQITYDFGNGMVSYKK